MNGKPLITIGYEDEKVLDAYIDELEAERDAALERAEQAELALKDATSVAEEQHGRFVKAFERAEDVEQSVRSLVMVHRNAIEDSREEALEEAAQVAQTFEPPDYDYGHGPIIAAAIRALKGDRS